MSAPTPATGDGSPEAGYYPDPSIPGYIRFWNGAAWVPGTSRPAPGDGEAMPAPPASAAPAPAPAPAVQAATGPSVEETGPVFLDEDPELASEAGPATGPLPAAEREAERDARPAPAWQADISRQRGFGDQRDEQVSWGAPGRPDPRVANPADPTGGALPGVRRVEPEPAARPVPEGTMTIRAPKPGTPRSSRAADVPAQQGPHTQQPAPAPSAPAPSTAASHDDARRRLQPRQQPQAQVQAQGQGRQQAQAHAEAEAQAQGPQERAQARQAAAHPGAQARPEPYPPVREQAAPAGPVPPQAASAAHAPAPAGTAPVTAGPGGGAASWAQQVHRLAQQQAAPVASAPLSPGAPAAAPGGDAAGQPVVPWKPPVTDPFLRAAQERASARPAGLGRRLAARVVDTLVLGGLAGAAGAPFVMQGVDHIRDKIEQARRSGETVTVWLVDGTTSVQFGIALGILLVLGVLYEAVPTARWGRTLGKKLCGLQVRGIESHEPPTFGAALRRRLVYSLLGLLVIGVLNVLWCLVDRPWRQCWHDKAAGTFVARH
ncbi:RDD family protein [Streptomyces sp. DH12]|uniref:RDD family protein n=1 Tax=Streptomyces sp. DH12 TaxID=2857010 RepID=UPI001E4C2DFA|nr:RDD family protein [Streptomyces sp. DH12]